ncbi:hypothetical protein ACFSOZ_12745 [Mesorhizobium newzealandense]|uniref:DUF982 domain-containing protein n=1 Tax=Mesorhizobium newzealandense TaxID=1300302 RepID=A0ABW4U7N9_9HYPH
MAPEREIQLILAAAAWLAATPKSQRPKPVIVEMRERHGLTAAQAIVAIRYCQDFQSKEEAVNDNCAFSL